MTNTSSSSSPDRPAAASELTLVVDLRSAIPIGYGNSWHAEVTRVVSGSLADSTLRISAFGTDVYDGHFLRPEAGVEVTFRQLAARPAALSGFDASDGTVWEIVSVKR